MKFCRKCNITSFEDEYVNDSIRLDIEDYRDLLSEERGIYRELSITRKKLEDNVNDDHLTDLIVGIHHEISENTGVQIEKYWVIFVGIR